MRRGNFGERVAHCKVWGFSVVSCAETTEPIDLPFGFLDLEEAQVQSYSQGSTIVHNFSLIHQVAPMYRMTLFHELCTKRLDRWICHLGCGLSLAKGSTSSIVFASWRQCANMGGHIGATWQIREYD